jgi:hypothetical protein
VKKLLSFGLALALLACLAPAGAQAAFGVNSLEVSALNSDGSPDLQAGSHPYEYKLSFKLNADGEDNPEGRIRDLFVDLPPGVVGNPQAVPQCPMALFEGATPQCPANTQIGIARIGYIGETVTLPIFNLVPPLGVAARVGFTLVEFNGFVDGFLRTGSDYGITVSDITVPLLPIQSVVTSIWGVPADERHDNQRCILIGAFGGSLCGGEPGTESGPNSSEAPLAPFFTLPTSCTGPLKTTISIDSVEEPGVFDRESAFSLDENGNPVGMRNCDAPSFDPTLTVQPETTVADSPTGLHVNLHIPQNEDPKGLATANLKDTVLTLPPGMVVNASAGDGLAACSSAQVDLKGPGPANCPAAAKMGTVEIKSPLLDHAVPGAVYLAKQGDNPFNSLLALYIAVDDPISGVVVKLAGRVEPDPVTGQLRTTFLNNPQLPFEDLSVDLPGGPRAPLSTPPTCGTYATTTALTPWTAPEGKSAFPSDSFAITTAPGGGCPASEAQMPNKPSFEAGTANPLAGAYSPFVLKLNRENGSQHLAALNLTLPPGLSAKLAGLSECSEAQIAQASARRNPGEGALEQASSSCPANSRLGTVNVGSGSGSPLYVQGHAYLAGPYKGAPLSMAIITPAIAGPFDLGTVVVRAALYINETTAQATVKSDPLPQILQGIPVDLRSVAVQIDRNQFTLNPTSCEVKALSAQAISFTGAVAALSNRFQVGACKALDFKPGLSLKLKGATKRGGHPALTATVTYPKGGAYANVARAQVALPHSEFLDTTHIKTICTRVQFAARTCPPGSIYGHAKAITPLLDKPLEGPVYLRSSSNPLPDLVADLNGQVHFVLAGRVDSVGGGTRTTFEAVPDAPVSKFILSMKGGKKGLLQNSTDICKGTHRATAKFTAHNGKVHNFNPPLSATSCGG